MATATHRLFASTLLVLTTAQSSACSASSASSERSTATGLAYEIYGQGEPILFIHGSFLEDALAPVIAEPVMSGFRRVHYERQGYGKSVARDRVTTIEEESRDARRLLEEQDIATVHVVGYSYGGVIALELARLAPSVVQSVVLVEPPLPLEGADLGGPPEFLTDGVRSYQTGDPIAAGDAFLEGIAGPDWKSQLAANVSDAVEKVRRNTALFFAYEVPAIQGYSMDSMAVAAVRQPILYILSSDHHVSHQLRMARFRAWHPQTEAVVIHDSDHALTMKQPQAVAKAIVAFLDRQSR